MDYALDLWRHPERYTEARYAVGAGATTRGSMPSTEATATGVWVNAARPCNDRSRPVIAVRSRRSRLPIPDVSEAKNGHVRRLRGAGGARRRGTELLRRVESHGSPAAQPQAPQIPFLATRKPCTGTKPTNLMGTRRRVPEVDIHPAPPAVGLPHPR